MLVAGTSVSAPGGGELNALILSPPSVIPCRTQCYSASPRVCGSHFKPFGSQNDALGVFTQFHRDGRIFSESWDLSLWLFSLNRVQFSSVTQSCPALCDPMDHSTPGLPVHHQLLEFTQTHVHWVGDAIQPSHPLSSPSPPALNLSQHQGLFKWVGSSHQVSRVLEFQLQHQSFQWTLRTDLLAVQGTLKSQQRSSLKQPSAHLLS